MPSRATIPTQRASGRRRPAPKAALLAAALVVGCVGCASRTATIRRPDGPPVEAVIDRSDASALYLRGPNGNDIPLGQLQVSEIEHPGDGFAMVGIGFVAGGLLLLAPAIVNQGVKNGAIGALAFAGVISLSIGTPMLVYNGIVWRGSKARAAQFEAARQLP